MIKKLKVLLSGSKIGWNEKELSTNDLDNLFKNEFSDSYSMMVNNNLNIIRGDSNLKYDYNYISTISTRYSENTYNVYTILLSEILPSWKNYPKRNHCVVCTNNYNKASNYGDNNIYKICVPNNTMLGICGNSDIWTSFPKVNSNFSDLYNLDSFNRKFINILDGLKIKYSNLNFKKILEIFEYFKNNRKKLEELYPSELLYYIIQNKDNLIQAFDRIFNPKDNGFELLSLNDYINKSHNLNNREIWFDSSYIAMKWNKGNDYLYYDKEGNHK
jgi:hypothetical protein